MRSGLLEQMYTGTFFLRGQLIKIITLGIFIALIFPDHSISKERKQHLFAKGIKPEKLAGDFEFTEGPASDKKGNIFFTDQPNNKIMKWSTDYQLSTFVENSGRANGMYFDKKGNLISCSDEKNELWSIAPNGQATVLVKDYHGKRLNGPNDLWIAPDGMTIDNKGNIYLTGNGVTIYDSHGVLVEKIPVPENSTLNVCFGG